tara:strand:- start:1511 stop:3529 length:2019 start_codon:yes stop_codon:yes gene_type:complete
MAFVNITKGTLNPYKVNTQTLNEGQFSWMTLDTEKQIGSEKQNTIDVFMYDNEGNQWHEGNYEGYGEFGGMDFYTLLAKMNGYSDEDLILKLKGKELRDLGIDIAFGKIKTKAKGNKVLFPALVEDPKFNWKRHDFKNEPESDPDQSWYQEDEYEQWDESLDEGTMSDIHMMAKAAKDSADFIKTFFKKYGDKIKKTVDSTTWAESLYKDTVAESVNEAEGTFKLRWLKDAPELADILRKDVLKLWKEHKLDDKKQNRPEGGKWGASYTFRKGHNKKNYIDTTELQWNRAEGPRRTAEDDENGGYEHIIKFVRDVKEVLSKNGYESKFLPTGGPDRHDHLAIWHNKDVVKSRDGFAADEAVAEATVVMDAIDPKSNVLKKLLKKHNVKMKVLTMNGPGGGNPEVELTGDKKDLQAVLADPNGWDDSDLGEYIEESVNEAASLVDEVTGKAVKLPYKTKDFRGDAITVKGFTEPHKSSSSGRIQTDQGEFFPGVAGVKIVGHKFEGVTEAKSNIAKKWDSTNTMMDDLREFITDAKDAGGEELVMDIADALKLMTNYAMGMTKESKDLTWNSLKESLGLNEGRSINKISKEHSQVVVDMKQTVDSWKEAEGDRKSELLEMLRELNKRKSELEKELDDAVAGKDRNVQLALEEAKSLAYLEIDIKTIFKDEQES